MGSGLMRARGEASDTGNNRGPEDIPCIPDGGQPLWPLSPSEAMNPAFVESLRFSARQKEKLLDIQGIWFQELQALKEERDRICASIRETPLGSRGSGAQAGVYLRCHDALSALKQNLSKDHILHIRLFHLTWKSCFTAEQCGKIIVQAYPWCPDAAAICRVVAAGHGNSQFHELPAEY
ncbi:hypothetical protein WJX84_000660 [Apatococcus fuscideae]|uniref:Uncharacterized protein n=1 Tax=Apatococcus fuscideae TaxID=2026836 RepID=A0AAW1T316_9CHLO